MPESMLILKLGGAAITDKAAANTPRLDIIEQLAALIARYPQPLILIHGAGSFGHLIAHEFSLQDGYQSQAQYPALVQLQAQLHQLNQIVVSALNKAGILAMPIHPASMCIMEKGRLVDLFLEPIQRMVNQGLVPVLYGDCVWDRAQVFSIISGDQLAVTLANELGASRLAFGTNVDGVLNANGRAIPRLNVKEQITVQAQKSDQIDVTGGMSGKLREIAALKNPAARTWIFNLHNFAHLEQILSGQAGAGTLVTINEEHE